MQPILFVDLDGVLVDLLGGLGAIVGEKVGKLDQKAVAAAIRGGCFSTKQTPGLLLDVCFDDKGDLDRESFMVEVKGGRQVVTATLPPLSAKK